jgi:hypothetical protein
MKTFLAFSVLLLACEPKTREVEKGAVVVDDLVAIPAGEFVGCALYCTEGKIDSEPTPDDRVRLANVAQSIGAFAIDRRDTSCDDFYKCVDAGQCPSRRPNCYGGRANVSLAVATQYCAWRGMHVVRLAELQRAIRWTDGRWFATGATWDPAACTAEDGLCRIRTPEGVELTIGGASAEWTSDVDCHRVGDLVVRAPVRMPLDSHWLTSVRVGEGGTAWFRCAR